MYLLWENKMFVFLFVPPPLFLFTKKFGLGWGKGEDLLLNILKRQLAC